MKKYIVISQMNTEILTPDLFSNEKDAYKFYANTLLREVIRLNNKEEYEKYDKIFKGSSVENIKNGIREMMGVVTKRVDGVCSANHGYAFDNFNYVVEIFVVKEK